MHRTRTGRWLQAAGENTFSWHAPLLCVLTVLIAPAGARYTARAQPAASGERMGIAFVPHMADALPPRGRGSKEQDAERDMYELAGQMPQVSRVYTPKDGQDVFRLLTRIQKLGRPIWFVALMGHGSSERPFIEFSQGAITPGDVDLPAMRHDLSMFQDIREKNAREGRQTEVASQKIREFTSLIERLEYVSLRMPPNAVVLLVNCFAAKADAGAKFTRQVGEVLVSARGGNVIASRNVVRANLIRSIADMMMNWWTGGDWQPFGGLGITGDWVTVPINPRGALTGLWHDASGMTCDLVQDGSRVGGSLRGGAGHFRLRGKVEGTVQGTVFRGSYAITDDRAETKGSLSFSITGGPGEQKLEGPGAGNLAWRFQREAF